VQPSEPVPCQPAPASRRNSEDILSAVIFKDVPKFSEDDMPVHAAKYSKSFPLSTSAISQALHAGDSRISPRTEVVCGSPCNTSRPHCGRQRAAPRAQRSAGANDFASRSHCPNGSGGPPRRLPPISQDDFGREPSGGDPVEAPRLRSSCDGPRAPVFLQTGRKKHDDQRRRSDAVSLMFPMASGRSARPQ